MNKWVICNFYESKSSLSIRFSDSIVLSVEKLYNLENRDI